MHIRGSRIVSWLVKCKEVGRFDSASGFPGSDLHALSINGDTQDLLANETGEGFVHAAWLGNAQPGVMLRVSGKPAGPPARNGQPRRGRMAG